MSEQTVRLDILIPQDAPMGELVERWQRAEELGFEAAYVADHTGDYRDLDGWWFDGWTVLAHVAAHTSRIRVGTLVANPLLRHPAQLVQQAIAVDHLSHGRLELGIGTGIAPFDHDAVGEPVVGSTQRGARLVEYVEVVEGLLRTGDRSFRYDGQFYRTAGAPTSPGPIQQPRPPITVGGQSPTVLQVAARHADCWNTHGPFGRTVEEIAELTAAQSERLDRLCESHDRDPAAVRRSVLLFGPLDPWTSDIDAADVVARFRQAGIHDFVAFWPPGDRVGELVDIVALAG